MGERKDNVDDRDEVQKDTGETKADISTLVLLDKVAAFSVGEALELEVASMVGRTDVASCTKPPRLARVIKYFGAG